MPAENLRDPLTPHRFYHDPTTPVLGPQRGCVCGLLASNSIHSTARRAGLWRPAERLYQQRAEGQ
jgi:hypothetical protein